MRELDQSVFDGQPPEATLAREERREYENDMSFGGDELPAPTSRICCDCERTSGKAPGIVYCDLHDEWVNDTDVECSSFSGRVHYAGSHRQEEGE